MLILLEMSAMCAMSERVLADFVRRPSVNGSIDLHVFDNVVQHVRKMLECIVRHVGLLQKCDGMQNKCCRRTSRPCISRLAMYAKRTNAIRCRLQLPR